MQALRIAVRAWTLVLLLPFEVVGFRPADSHRKGGSLASSGPTAISRAKASGEATPRSRSRPHARLNRVASGGVELASNAVLTNLSETAASYNLSTVDVWRRDALRRAGGGSGSAAAKALGLGGGRGGSLVQRSDDFSKLKNALQLQTAIERCRTLRNCGCLDKFSNRQALSCGWCETSGTGLLGYIGGPHEAEGSCGAWIWHRDRCPIIFCPADFDTSAKWSALISASVCPCILWCLFTLSSLGRHLLQDQDTVGVHGLASLRRDRSEFPSRDGGTTSNGNVPRRWQESASLPGVAHRAFRSDLLWRAMPMIFLQAYVVGAFLTSWRMSTVFLPPNQFQMLAAVLDSVHTVATATASPVLGLFAFYCIGRLLWWRQALEIGRAARCCAAEVAASAAAGSSDGEDLFDVYRYLVLHLARGLHGGSVSVRPPEPLEQLEASGWLTNAETKVLAGSGSDSRVYDKWIALWINSHVRDAAAGRAIEDRLSCLRSHLRSLHEVLEAPAPWLCHAALYTMVRGCLFLAFAAKRVPVEDREMALETPVEMQVLTFTCFASVLQISLEVLHTLRHPFGVCDGHWGSQAIILEAEAAIRKSLAHPATGGRSK